MEGCDLFLLCSIILCVLYCPYTKVEESFNMQAVSDFHKFGFNNLNSFDHLEFPGVVPRTFVGALCVYVLSSPLKIISSLSGLHIQIGSRLILGFIGWISFLHLKKGIAWRFGLRVAQFTMILSGFQFHLCFYLSRTLPNTFALIICIFAFGYWLQGFPYKAIAAIATAMIIFRCDMLVLLAPLVLQLLISREITFVKGFLLGILVCSCSMLLTVTLDSYMWQRGSLLWPEGVVLFFNTVQNKSSEWGVMPAHWYFSSALLKSQNVSLIWLVCGIFNWRFPTSLLSSTTKDEISVGETGVNRKLCYYLLPVLCFVSLYSILPHKELRFIFPALPLLTMGSAVGLDGALPRDTSLLYYPLNQLYRSARLTVRKGWLPHCAVLVACLAMMGSLLAQAVLFRVFLSASEHNYPGGVALHSLISQHVRPSIVSRESALWEALRAVAVSDREEKKNVLRHAMRPIFVHIDVAAAMTGVTRFGQEQMNLFGDTHIPNLTQPYLNVEPTTFDWESFNKSLDSCVPNQFLDDASVTVTVDEEVESIRQCMAEINMLFYSKDEIVRTEYDQYDWLITEYQHRGGQRFRVAQEVEGFHKMTFSKRGYLPELKTQLYILNRMTD